MELKDLAGIMKLSMDYLHIKFKKFSQLRYNQLGLRYYR